MGKYIASNAGRRGGVTAKTELVATEAGTGGIEYRELYRTATGFLQVTRKKDRGDLMLNPIALKNIPAWAKGREVNNKKEGSCTEQR